MKQNVKQKVNSKRNRNNSKFRPREEESREVERPSKYNDISWYSKNPSLLQDAGSFSFNTPNGVKIDKQSIFTNIDSDNPTLLFKNNAVPGIMAMYYVYGPGVSETSTSPANLAAQNIYSYVRYMNSGAKNYDQADLMMYLLAMDSIYVTWNYLKRAYGIMRKYSSYDRYLPKAMFTAMGLDFDDFVGNEADFRAFLNRTAAQISSFCVPGTMSLFLRHSWMTSNVFKDTDTNKYQSYMFVPAVYYTYSETTSQYGGQLKSNQLAGFTVDAGDISLLSFAEVRQILQKQLDAVGYSEDIGVMSGDILKAYGQDKLFKLSSIDPEYTVEPVYSPEVLDQIHNAVVLNQIVDNAFQAGNYITQDPNSGYLLYNPEIILDNTYYSNAFIDIPDDDTRPEKIMIATRLTCTMKEATSGDGSSVLKFNTMGSEFIAHAHIFSYMYDDKFGVELDNVNVPSVQVIAGANAKSTMNNIYSISLWSQFNLAYMIWRYWADGTTSPAFDSMVQLGSVNNWTIMSHESLERLHEAALLSEFNVPQIGSF